MNIILNNNPETIDINKKEITVDELLRHKNFSFKLLVVKINGLLVKKENYASAIIRENDKVIVLHMISGG